ncbi:MAG: hypothetical protein MUF59_10695 [Candidatus Krumholzibacteria bacterium]|jgi:hypothetical protein|nr:hypothetical protein [Candidatus Krumholzibacteria bacterium]
MPGFEYTISQGDSVAGLARRYRIEGGWRAIWDDEHNDELRRLRGGIDGLLPGDRIFIPGAEGNICETPSGGAVDFTAPPPFRIFAVDGSSMPSSAVPVNGTIQMKAIHDEGTSGTWTWSTPSAKITLSNQATDTVTITAGAGVSSGISAEEIRLTFAPADGGTSEGAAEDSSENESCEESAAEATSEPVCDPDAEAAEEPIGGPVYVATRITVISVAFSASPSHPWGYDGMGADCDDPTPAGQTPHLSVKQRSRGEVAVTVTGGATGGVLRFTSDDASIAEAEADGTPPANFTLFIDGKAGGSETIIRVRANADDGPICASLTVNVYQEKACTAKIAKVWDSTSASTALSRPNFSVADTQTAVREYYKQTVATINLSDYNSSGQVIDVNFDPGGAGALVLEAGRTSTGEQAINNAITGTDKKIVIVKDLQWLFNLGTASAVGDGTITLGSHITSDLMAYITPDTYQLGGPGNYEEVVVTAADVNTRVVTLANPVTKVHPVTEGLWWPLGGLSGDPAFVKEGSDSQEMVNKVIGHEVGHEILALRDLDKLECMMHFSNSRTGMKIRFKDLPRFYNPPGGNENQWNAISRP